MSPQDLINSLGGVVIAAALLTLFGVLLTAVSNLFQNTRSKYVDVIASERIKWVGAIRGDFRELFVKLDKLRFDAVKRGVKGTELQASADAANSQVALIALKMNADDQEDRRLLRTVMWLSYFSTQGSDADYNNCRNYVSLLVNFKLKDEWEKAKREAAGPLKWALLKVKEERNLNRRRSLIDSSFPKQFLEKIDRNLEQNQLFVEIDDPEATDRDGGSDSRPE